MDILKRSIGILMLLAFLSGKYTMLFNQTKESIKIHWSKSAEDPTEENKEKEEERKETSSYFDEYLSFNSLLMDVFQMSQKLNTHYLLSHSPPYLSSYYLPPEA
jgi:hypothetical protein